jgi:hypothetical protein
MFYKLSPRRARIISLISAKRNDKPPGQSFARRRDLTRRQHPTLRDILTAVPVFDGYNMPLSQFINECREVQNALLPHEEANVLILLRSKLRGWTRQAINNHKFTTIKQLTDRLQISFDTIRDTCDCYAELKKLSTGRRENIGYYIGRAQILHDNIIEVEKNEKQSLTNSDISKINCQFIDEFYCDLSSDIWTLVKKRDDCTPVEFHEIIEKVNRRPKREYDTQQAYSAPHKISRYEPGAKTRTIP